MKKLWELLNEARSEIIGGLVVAGILATIAVISERYNSINVWNAIFMLLGGTWLGCAYIFFKRAKPSVKRPGNVAKKKGKKVTKELQSAESWQYSRNWRRAALTGLIIIPLLAVSGIYQRYILTQPPREFLVLVADFKGPEPENYRVTETVLNRLCEVLKPYNHAKVESLGRAITEAEGSSVARAEGEKRKASIVIWGWYGVTAQVVPLSINFEILCPLRCSPTLSGDVQGEVQKIAVGELESFTLQSQLSDEMALLSLFVIGLVEYSVENWDKAIASFTDALSQVGERKSALEVYYYRGMAHLWNDDYDQSLADFNRAIELDSNFALAYSGRAVFHVSKGNIDEAIADFTQAITLDSENELYYHNRGVFYAEYKHDYDESIVDFTRAITIEPNNPANYKDRGMSYYWKDDYDRAITDLDQAVSLFEQEIKSDSDEDFKENFARALVYRAAIYDHNHDYTRALLQLNQAIELKPDYANAYHGRAAVYSHIGEVELAIADLTRGVELSDDPVRRQQMEEELRALRER